MTLSTIKIPLHLNVAKYVLFLKYFFKKFHNYYIYIYMVYIYPLLYIVNSKFIMSDKVIWGRNIGIGMIKML